MIGSLVTSVQPLTAGIVLLFLSTLGFFYKRALLFTIGSIGQLIWNGNVLLKEHLKSGSKFLLLDTISMALVYIVLSAAFTQPNLLFYGLSFAFSVTLSCKTVEDQFTLSCSDEELKKLYNNFIEETDSNSVEMLREKKGKSVVATRALMSEEKVSKLKEFSWKDIKTHNKQEDLWIVVDGLVLELTKFFPDHPGGRKVLLSMGGRDCSVVMEVYHPSNVFLTLPKYCIGRVATDVGSEVSESVDSESESVGYDWKSKNEQMMADYRKMRQFLLKLNLFETDLDYFAVKYFFGVSLMGIGIFLNLYSESFWVHMLAAFLVGSSWQQLAFIGHDVGHTAVTHDRDMDYEIGTTAGVCLGGISLGWWKYSHNTHHVVCNSVEDDPDIQHMPVFAVNKSMLSSFFSKFHQKVFPFDFAAKILLSFQHFLFYPVMAFARINLYLQSLLYFFYTPQVIDGKFNHDAEFKYTDFAGYMMFFITYGAIISTLPNLLTVLFSALVTHAVSGVLHVQICISHFSMKSYEGQYNSQIKKDVVACATDEVQAKEVEMDMTEEEAAAMENWLLLQINTTMDVECPTNFDFFHGGLQFQIEHHLFPRLPRHNLRIAQVLAKDLCKKYNIHHHNPTFVEANKELVGHLRMNAMEARTRDIDRRDFTKSEMYEAMNLIG